MTQSQALLSDRCFIPLRLRRRVIEQVVALWAKIVLAEPRCDILAHGLTHLLLDRFMLDLKRAVVLLVVAAGGVRKRATQIPKASCCQRLHVDAEVDVL